MLGGVGFHNFYAGHIGSGATKLFLFLVTFTLDTITGFQSAFSVLWLAISWLWALIEAFAVDKDARGNRML